MVGTPAVRPKALLIGGLALATMLSPLSGAGRADAAGRPPSRRAAAAAWRPARPPSRHAAAQARRHARLPLRYVALGDSYSSGEANPPFVRFKGSCDLSRRHAWPELLAAQSPGRVRLVADLACSGATIAALTAPFKGQPAQVPVMARLRPNLVTITIGGNDAGFGEIVGNCFAFNCVRDGELARASARIRRLRPALVSAYREIKRHLHARAEVLVVGYPRLLPLRERDRRGCPWLQPGEQPGLNRIADELNSAVRRAARQARVPFVSTLNAFVGHELCTAHPWVWEVGRPPLAFDAHPTLPGQQAMARIVRNAVSRRGRLAA